MKQGASSLSRKNKEAGTPSKPNSSFIKIDSISINIDADEQRNPGKCEHFSIRGYVSDVRNQNVKLCCPFSVVGDDTFSKEINSRLCSFDIPKFKSWRCKNCVNEIAAVRATEVEYMSVNCSRRLETKSHRSHRSLENVIAHLANKLKQPLKPGPIHCESTKSASGFMPKRILDSALRSSTRGLEEIVQHSAANGFHSNQQDSNNQLLLTNIDKLQKQLPVPKTATTKFGIVDGAHHRGHEAVTKLVHNHHQQNDDSISPSRRKTKIKKVRLLNEIVDKNGKGVQPAMTESFHTDESAKVSCGSAQGLQQSQSDTVRSHAGQKRNKKYLEQDSRQSQMHNADNLDGNVERRKTHDINTACANPEMPMTSKDVCSDAISNLADKMLFISERGADGHMNCHDRGQKSKNDSYRRQQQMSTTGQPFLGRVTDSVCSSSLPPSQSREKSSYIVNRVHRNVNGLASTGNGKELEGNSVPPNSMGTVHIGHQTQSFQPMQAEYPSKHHHIFYDGSLEASKGTLYWIPPMENGNFRNEIAMQSNGKSSSACKPLIDKNILQGRKSTSGFKRPNQGSCDGNKRPKHITRTEGGHTVVHHSESSLGNRNKKMGGTPDNPINTVSEFRGNMMQEVGNSDDIPMDIVELLAKNQHDRNLHEVEDNHAVLKTGYKAKNDLVSTSMLPNAFSQAEVHEKSQLQNSRVLPGNDSDILNGRPYIIQRPTGSAYRPLLPSQRDRSSVLQLHAAASSKTDIFPNCKYDTNKVASETIVSQRSQAIYEPRQPAFQQSGETAHAWPIVPPTNPVHMASVFQGNAWPLFKNGKVTKCPSYVGETRDYNNIGWADFGTNHVKAEASRTSLPIRVDIQPLVSGSPDPYANEAISAIHQLSLLNGRSQSSTPTNMDVIANRRTFDRSFSNDHLAKELSGNSFGVGKPSHKFKQPSPYGYNNKNLQSNAAWKCSPPMPTFGLAVASHHRDAGNKRDIQTSSQHPEAAFFNGKAGGSPFPTENNSFKYQNSQSASTGGVAFQDLISASQLANHIFNPSRSVGSSSQLYMNGNFSKCLNSATPDSYEAVNRRPESGVCSVNRNPMDFTIPGLGNEYMIGSEELKLRKTYPSYISRPVATYSFQQQWHAKYTIPINDRH